MAFIEGESLDKQIEQGPLRIAEALAIAQQIAKGLEAAHEKKIVHRDIKPGNVIVDEKGHVTVMEFGLALLTEGSKLTQLDTTVGTAAYMSPEQSGAWRWTTAPSYPTKPLVGYHIWVQLHGWVLPHW